MNIPIFWGLPKKHNDVILTEGKNLQLGLRDLSLHSRMTTLSDNPEPQPPKIPKIQSVIAIPGGNRPGEAISLLIGDYFTPNGNIYV